ncbi:M23 family metallopeptidase [Mesorhizobium sp. LHD-90]|uniref:M23 family metallopeptidase n=1 Tax=Mesorhizobium sp. LHD-90 TaxID=3071414 RepID=UPI0027E179C3|nr:M23 family metallopeptidase [Mesorhizobium sp. LHD-90]MDQ6436199.1 M23 family metallopeptidase [Mesorhizobium sp. LHD-90]
MSPVHPAAAALAVSVALAFVSPRIGLADEGLGLPADCKPGQNCFVQQFADMDAGPGVADPFCGTATYDGHDGIDLRVRSMADVKQGIAVTAVADGAVDGLRDGVPDRLVITEADRAAVAGIDCGNGVLLDHGGGMQTQYCHMRQGSVTVNKGDQVKRGEKLGEIGASGMAAFPHVHLTARKEGKPIDPMTGRPLSQGCLKDGAQPASLFEPDVAGALGKGGPQLLGAGLAGGPLDYDALVVDGAPPAATGSSPNLVGWGWFMNLRKGDRIYISIVGPDGDIFAETMSPPLDRSKAAYSSFTGKRGSPKPGRYQMTIEVLENMQPVLSETRDIVVE